MPLGTVLVATLAPALGTAYGWRWGALAIAVVGVLSALAQQPLRRALEAYRHPARRAPGWPPGLPRRVPHRPLRSEPRLRAVAHAACGGHIAVHFLAFFVVWQVQALETLLVEAGARLAAGQVTGALGRVGWAMAADRSGAPPVIVMLAPAHRRRHAGGPGRADWPGRSNMALAEALGATAVVWEGMTLAVFARLAPPGRVGAATAAFGVISARARLGAPGRAAPLAGVTGGLRREPLFCRPGGFAAGRAAARKGRCTIRRPP